MRQNRASSDGARRSRRNCDMNDHILVFYDREGNERFFLRRKATTPDIQRYLLCFALCGDAETP